ncbi:MBL fold metallo-hydrolase [Myxosarcina sp. GI1]|uniref:MBL fold metallo-hydrolase n=1 Tax=Myxosarcina sp. GI1 TaxID=1541065 RepID=UPI00056CD84F|nr:MBL fold metallo-hydrolase [Myxosarcina sp. GI1]
MKNYYHTKLVSIGLGLLLLFTTGKPTLAQNYQIERIRGNVYRFTAGNYRSVFMETDGGIVVSDPINKEAATWLKQELAKRFDKPIRYVVYSHNHPDHVYGGEVFDGEGVQFVSHQLAREDLVRTLAKTRIPNLVFEDEMVLYIDNNLVRLRYHGRNNGRGSISMLFEPAGVLHVVDWIVLGRMPYKDLQGYDIQGMIDSTQEVLNMDFDIFVGGHAEIGQKEDIKRYLSYLQTLYNSVRDGILAGKDLATLQQEIRLDDYRDLPMYEEWLPLNIKGVYRTLVDESYLLRRSDVTPSQ